MKKFISLFALLAMLVPFVSNGQEEVTKDTLLRANTDPLSVRDQARHSSLLITNTYTPLDIKDANPLILRYRGVL